MKALSSCTLTNSFVFLTWISTGILFINGTEKFEENRWVHLNSLKNNWPVSCNLKIIYRSMWQISAQVLIWLEFNQWWELKSERIEKIHFSESSGPNLPIIWDIFEKRPLHMSIVHAWADNCHTCALFFFPNFPVDF